MGDSGEVLAQSACHSLSELLSNPPRANFISWQEIIKFIGALMAPVLFILILLIIAKLTKKIIRFLLNQEGKLIKGIKIGKLTVLSARDELMLLIRIVRWGQVIFALVLFYVMILAIFNLYPATQQIGDKAIYHTFQFLKNIGAIILRIIVFVAVLLAFYILSRVALKIVEMVFHYYEKGEVETNISNTAFLYARKPVKILIVIILALFFITLIPDNGIIISAVILCIVLGVFTVSLIPLIKHYISGYFICAKELLQEGERVYYRDKWWIVHKLTPMYVVLILPEDNKKLIRLSNDFLSDGFIKEEMPENIPDQQEDRDISEMSEYNKN